MTPLEAEIRRIIAIDGPIPVDRYMELCLAHPRHGYYVTRDPLGARGDFVTAPEVSQMFGELIGAWAAAVWSQMGSPKRVQLIELGPGRGTLMADALRAAQALPQFHAALSVHLVESSPALRAAQEKALANADVSIAWHHGIEEIEEGPAIAIANEFVDALPIGQFVKDRDGWHIRMVGLVHDRLAFVATPDAMIGPLAATDAAPAGTILERRHDRPVSLLSRRIARHGGAALVIGYWVLTLGICILLYLIAIDYGINMDKIDAAGPPQVTAAAAGAPAVTSEAARAATSDARAKRKGNRPGKRRR